MAAGNIRDMVRPVHHCGGSLVVNGLGQVHYGFQLPLRRMRNLTTLSRGRV